MLVKKSTRAQHPVLVALALTILLLLLLSLPNLARSFERTSGSVLTPNQRPSKTVPSLFAGSADPAQTSVTVGKWERMEIVLPNESWSGNPFDLDLHAVFTHIDSGRTITQLGFYAGEDTWKVFFMPDGVGEWTYVTVSSDSDLDGKTGGVQAVSSDLPGRLVPDGNRWSLEESGEHVAPIMLPSRQWFKRTETNQGVGDFIAWADDVAGSRIIGTTLVYFSHNQDEIPYVKGQEGVEFNIEMWDRLNDHFDTLRDRGMGHYIMFYSDDSESPNRYGISGRSQAELRLFRYAAARFSAYPMVIWDTGIDIGETRDDAWIDWFAQWFGDNDPWRHPVSSRTGGGSGGSLPNGADYYSDGASTLPSHSQLVSQWQSRSIPTMFTDRWREDYGRGSFDRNSIRRAAWEVGLVGGMGAYISGNENGGYLTENYSSDLRAAPDLGYRTWYLEVHIDNFGSMVPLPELVTAGKDVVLVGVQGEEYVAYAPRGGRIGIDLSLTSGSFAAEWYNPRNGDLTPATGVDGGAAVSFDAPSSEDWVLRLWASEGGGDSDPRIRPSSTPYDDRIRHERKRRRSRRER